MHPTTPSFLDVGELHEAIHRQDFHSCFSQYRRILSAPNGLATLEHFVLHNNSSLIRQFVELLLFGSFQEIGTSRYLSSDRIYCVFQSMVAAHVPTSMAARKGETASERRHRSISAALCYMIKSSIPPNDPVESKFESESDIATYFEPSAVWLYGEGRVPEKSNLRVFTAAERAEIMPPAVQYHVVGTFLRYYRNQLSNGRARNPSGEPTRVPWKTMRAWIKAARGAYFTGFGAPRSVVVSRKAKRRTGATQPPPNPDSAYSADTVSSGSGSSLKRKQDEALLPDGEVISNSVVDDDIRQETEVPESDAVFLDEEVSFEGYGQKPVAVQPDSCNSADCLQGNRTPSSNKRSSTQSMGVSASACTADSSTNPQPATKKAKMNSGTDQANRSNNPVVVLAKDSAHTAIRRKKKSTKSCAGLLPRITVTKKKTTKSCPGQLPVLDIKKKTTKSCAGQRKQVARVGMLRKERGKQTECSRFGRNPTVQRDKASPLTSSRAKESCTANDRAPTSVGFPKKPPAQPREASPPKSMEIESFGTENRCEPTQTKILPSPSCLMISEGPDATHPNQATRSLSQRADERCEASSNNRSFTSPSRRSTRARTTVPCQCVACRKPRCKKCCVCLPGQFRGRRKLPEVVVKSGCLFRCCESLDRDAHQAFSDEIEKFIDQRLPKRRIKENDHVQVRWRDDGVSVQLRRRVLLLANSRNSDLLFGNYSKMLPTTTQTVILRGVSH